MALAVGTRLGSYEIVALIGAGGMGEVYRARDARLHRDVALKILPELFAADPERRARFQREAQVLASLNHPHIAAIYGFEEPTASTGSGQTAGGALVLELVEGPTLADRIAQGPIPLEEALPIARQIAEALQAAHEQGIVHRDLKPANIKLRPDQTVKVLDFGLAKALEPAPVATDTVHSLTITSPAMTRMGVILGTAAYMSPEQAAGHAADRRSDLWAFGVVFLEMLSGRPTFTGDTVSHVLAAVLKSEPDWTALPDETPAAIRRLLRRCLEKDRRRRLDSAADARLEIEDALASPAPENAAAASRYRGLPIALALAIGALLATLVMWAVMRPASTAPGLLSRFTIGPPPAYPLRISPYESTLTISPDGRYLAYSSSSRGMAVPGSGTSGALLVRPLGQLDARPLAASGRNPFFSPDGAWMGFFDDNDFILKKVSLSGGPAVNICRFAGGPRGASWGADNTIVFATGDPATGLWRVPAGSGDPMPLTTPEPAGGEGDHLFPSVLPGGRGVLFTIGEPWGYQPDRANVAVLDSKTAQRKTLIRGGSHAQYLESGHLVYAAAGTLRAVRFDLAALEVLSDPVPVVEQVMMTPSGAAYYAVSQAGTLVYVPRIAAALQTRSLVWVDRQGREEAINAPPRAYAAPRLSPDGTRVAVEIRDQENDIWIWDLARETLRKLTDGPASDHTPTWTADGRRVVFSSDRAGPSNLYMQAADGTGTVRRLTTSGNAQWATSVLPNDAAIVGHEFGPTTSFDVFLLPGSGEPATISPGDVQPLIQTALAQSGADVSPDGRYLVYQSNEAGPLEIYVRPFPHVDDGKWPVSTAGGSRPVWAKNGRELFYVDGSQNLVSVPVETSASTFAWGNPAKVFDYRPYSTGLIVIRDFDVSHDGRKFLMLKDHGAGGSDATSAQIEVVLNWVEELKVKVPTGR